MAENKPQNLIRIIPAEEKNMKKKILNAGALSRLLCTTMAIIATTQFTYGQTDKRDTVKVKQLEKVVISDSRVSNKAPLTTSTLNREQLDEEKISISLPYMLETQPSVVTSSENGAVGVTSMRIRGVDATRINVNINGIPLNDGESQTVYWYNIPNLGGMSQSVQLQRGLGASNGGTASFGGAMNLQTLNTASQPYGSADLGWGSFNTRQYGFTAGTGITKHGFTFDVAYNGLTSDGWQRGGQTKQQSIFLNAGWYGEKSMLKAIAIIGDQHTGITWNGATAEELDADPHFNSRGSYTDSLGNVYYYGNETDNYLQQRYQLYYTQILSDNLSLNAAVDYTMGNGYTESYKDNKKATNFAMGDLIASGVKSDFITRKNMDNDAITTNLSMRYNKSALTLTYGLSYQHYTGGHLGEVIWSQLVPTVDEDFVVTGWDDNTGVKNDGVVFAKLNYDFSNNFNLYADLQARRVSYSLHGIDDDYGQVDYDTTHLFFNPKLGLNYRIDDNQRLYVVAGISNREPNRTDIKEACADNDTISPETMLDIELGYQIKKNRFHFEGNLYAMLYKNQLTATGVVTESGYALMENVDKSYRIGAELVAGYQFDRHFSLEGNLTLSTNKIVDYQYEITLNDWYTKSVLNLGTTDLAFSPSIVGAAVFTYRPVEQAKLQLVGKYVGEQYADNTSREDMLVDDYFLLNLRASYTFNMKSNNELECQLAVNNILNHQYRLSAYAYGVYDPATQTFENYRGYFQQPGINFMARVIYRF